MEIMDGRRAQRLRDMRKARNMSQLEVAEKIGVSRTAYIKYESGKGGIPGKSLLELADLFETTTDYLLCRKQGYVQKTQEPMPQNPYFEVSKARADLQSLINAMNEEAVEMLLGIAKVVAERRVDPTE